MPGIYNIEVDGPPVEHDKSLAALHHSKRPFTGEGATLLSELPPHGETPPQNFCKLGEGGNRNPN